MLFPKIIFFSKTLTSHDVTAILPFISMKGDPQTIGFQSDVSKDGRPYTRGNSFRNIWNGYHDFLGKKNNVRKKHKYIGVINYKKKMRTAIQKKQFIFVNTNARTLNLLIRLRLILWRWHFLSITFSSFHFFYFYFFLKNLDELWCNCNLAFYIYEGWSPNNWVPIWCL